MRVEITDFCNKIFNFIKFQGICKRYLMRKKFDFVLKELIFRNPSIEIQRYFRGYRIRNIFHRCYNRKNSSCPFKIRNKERRRLKNLVMALESVIHAPRPYACR